MRTQAFFVRLAVAAGLAGLGSIGATMAPAYAAPSGPTCTLISSTAPGTINCSSEDGDEAKFFVNTTQPGGATITGSFNKNNGPDDMSLTANVSVEPPSQGYGEIKPATMGDSWQTSTFAPSAGSAFAFDGIFPNMQIIDSSKHTKYDGDLFAVVTNVSGGTSVFEWTGLKTDADLNRVVGLDEPAGSTGIAIASVEFLLAGTLPGGAGFNTDGFFKSMKQIDVSICESASGCVGGGGTPPPPPIPEPSTWAMMLLGFIGLGFIGYRKAKTARTAFSAA
jgi:hypothetical protein